MRRNKLSIFLTRMGYTNPLRLLLIGYASYIFIAWFLLSLPISWQSESVSLLDNLFTATSAVSTTGLATVSTPDSYNFLGEFIIFCAFQLGGLGYMTLGSFILIIQKKSLPYLRRRVGDVAFSLPENFNFKAFIRHTVFFTLISETIGAVFLYIFFRNLEVKNALWAAIFHSVSAFCTAGFSIFPNSLEDFRDDLGVNIVISILSLLGAIGFLVASDFWQTWRGKRRNTTLTTRIILWMTGCFIGSKSVL